MDRRFGISGEEQIKKILRGDAYLKTKLDSLPTYFWPSKNMLGLRI